ncbi:CxxxxCH/CxxCH domain-containing protein [Anaeromyxobacter sp. SG17]|uniref:CxxxxCH/CxxCH domain c-type cytochrome n=1 Tax=Anaeromyxobacter sp. SG17 TaxID=2925405 RepID=UPI001F59C87A|nr:CxxxxCH/CxxCH domain-containing protein [Anaeromyxobacter sp. SG17]
MPDTTRRTRASRPALRQPSGRARAPRSLPPLAAALTLLLSVACGDSGAQRPADRAAPRAQSAALVARAGSPAHELYASKGFTCEACHPCGTRSPDGHGVTWMDQASPEFHAASANRDLASCKPCHGANLDGVGGSVTVSCAQCHGASWKTTCTLCHGGTDGTTGAPPKTTWGNASDAVRIGTHTSHVAAAHALAGPVGCAICHPVPADALSAGHADATTATVAFTGLAVQGVILTPTWDRAQATCSNTYCHGATLAGGASRTPIWTVTDGSQRACSACHGAPPPPPHVQNPACGECHSGYGAATVNAALHVDGKIDATVTCTSCHGSAANAAPPRGTRGETLTSQRAVGAHQTHLAGSAISNPLACTECHVVPTTTSHADGPVQLAWGPLASARGAVPGFDPVALTCANYCHGQTLAAGGASTTPLWTKVDGTQVTCGSCHGAPPPAPHTQNPACELCHVGYTATSVNLATHLNGALDVKSMTCTSCHGSVQNAAPPYGTRGETATTDLAVGAHQQHLAGGVVSNPIACGECHLVPAAMDHADGGVGLAWGALASRNGAIPQWDRATATCSSTYCHGQFVGGNPLNAPAWTTVNGTQAACGTCHGAPPPAPHPQNAACEGCHSGYTASSVALATHVNGTVEVALSCNSCHGSATNAAPPAGTHGETLETQRAVGAHQKHLAGGPLRGPMDCAECHVVPASMDHANGTPEITFGTLSRTDGAAPIWDPQTLACSSTWCHGALLRGGGTNQAPVWTGGAAQTACGTCHLTPPPPPHPRTQICDNCHPGYTITSVNLAKHINGLVEAENLTCSSCHGDNSRVLVMQADPLAIAAPPYGSRGETDSASRSVGQHQAHVNRGNGLSIPNKCRYCHAVPTTFDHANGVSQVTFGSLATMDGATPTFDGQTCSNTYCHGSTLGRGGTDHSPTWTNPAPVTCTTCHGAPPPAPHPQDADCIRCHPGYTSTSVRKATHVNGVSDFPSGCNSCHDIPPMTGEHLEHLHERITCDRCHAGYTTTSENPVLHRNARQDVTLSGWDPTRRTCSNIGCHGSEYWGRTGQAARQSCNQCHGVPPASGEHFEHSEYACSRCHGTGYSTTTTNSATHMNNVADVPFAFYDRTTRTCSSTGCHGYQRWGTPSPVTPNCANCHGFPPAAPHPQDTACQSCHPSMLASGVLTATHNNGTLDISGQGCQSCHGFPPTATRKGGAHPADSNCYGCHPTTVDASNQVVPDGTHNDGYVQVGGGGVGTYGCQTCHGDQARQAPAGADANVKSAPPFGTRGETEPTTRAVGAHLAHVSPAAGTLAGPAACSECHPVPAAMDHANGTVLLAFGGRATLQGAAPLFDPVAVSCASTYCHGATLGAGGTNHAPTWTGGAAEAACGTCHGAPPPLPHTQNTSCGGCHEGYTATSVNLAQHVNGTVEISAMACNSCHGNGTNAAPPQGTAGETLTTTRAVGAHQQHLAGSAISNPVACAECHVVPTGMNHKDGVAQLAWGPLASAGGAGASFDTTALTCTNYCHGATLAAGGSNTTPLWTAVDGTQAACGACHGAPPPAPHSSNPSCGNCHTGYTATTVNLATHVNGTLDVVPLSCTSCHGSAQNAAPPVGTNGETLTTSLAVGAHQQHLAGGAYSNPIACSECHVVPTAMSHADAAVQLAFGTLAKTGGAAPAWDPVTATCSSSYCHGQFVGGDLLNAPSWTTVNGTQAACGTCHGAPPPAPHSANTACGSCHDGYTQTSVNLATHVNGVVEAQASPHAPGWSDKTQHGYQANLTGLAGCKSCHGDLGATTSCGSCHTSAGFASWDTNCTFCHGSTTSGRQNPPVDIQGRTVTTNVSVGVHEAHATTTIAAPLGCVQCHPARTTSVRTDTAHVDGNGIAEVVLGTLAKTGGAPATYTRTSATSATCASTYCHGRFSGGVNSGSGATVAWTSTTQVGCTSCHGNPPSTGRHSTHQSRSVPCTNCHNAVVNASNGFVDRTLHVNGADNVKLGGTYSGRSVTGTWNASTRSCSSLSCHGSETW